MTQSIELATFNFLMDNLQLLPKQLQVEPSIMNEISYRNWYYDVSNYIYKEREDMKKIFNEFIEKTKRYSWVERIDKKGNRLEFKINFYNKDVFDLSLLCLKNDVYIMFTDCEFYSAIKTYDIDLIIKQIVKIVRIRNYDLIETYNEIGVDLINY